MNIGKLLTIAAALILSCGIAIAAPRATSAKPAKTESPAAAKVTTHHLMGTISSVTSSDLTVAHKVRNKQESSTFMLNSKTKKEGTLAKGAYATVYYHVEKNNQKVATEVKVQPSKSKA